MMRKPELTDIRAPRSRNPRRARRDASVERSLTEVRGPPEGPGYSGHVRGEDRAAELPPLWELVRSTSSF